MFLPVPGGIASVKDPVQKMLPERLGWSAEPTGRPVLITKLDPIVNRRDLNSTLLWTKDFTSGKIH